MAESKNTDELDAIALIIEEQKSDHNYLLHIYNRLRATEGLLLTGAFGIVAYLYYGASDGDKIGISQRLFVPEEDYGKVIYFMAAAFFVYGICKLMIKVFGNNPWMTPYEITKTDYKYTPLEVSKYFSEKYKETFAWNMERYDKRKNELGFLFYCILVSAIILIVIKTLG